MYHYIDVILRSLRSVRFKLSDDEIQVSILAGLPQTYSPHVSAIEGCQMLSLDYSINFLKAVYDREKSEDLSSRITTL